MTDTDSPTPQPGEREALARVIRDCHMGGKPYNRPMQTDWRAFADAILARFTVTPRPATDGPAVTEVDWDEAARYYDDDPALLAATAQPGSAPTDGEHWRQAAMEERAERQRGRDRLVDAERRLKRIANEHQKHVDGHGGTYGECNDCGWQWPCPTYQWATATVTDVNCTWDLTDCEFEHDHFAAHPGTDIRDDGEAT